LKEDPAKRQRMGIDAEEMESVIKQKNTQHG
jgi:hypothetical protein